MLKRGMSLAGALCFLCASLCSRGRQQPMDVTQSPPPVAADQKITLAQAVETALQKNPQITASEHTVAGARANLGGQRAPINPTIAYSGLNNTVALTNFGDPANYAVYFTVETSGRIRYRTGQARALLQGAQADAVTTRISVKQAVASAYIALQVANSALENEQEAYQTARRLSDLTEKQFKLGAAPETNAIRASVALNREEQNLIQAINSVRVARANLNVQVGREPDLPIDAAEPLRYTPIELSLTELRRQALLNRPEIRSAEASRRALQSAVGLQQSQYYPDTVVGSDLRFHNLQLGLVLPLFDFGGIRGAVRQAKEAVRTQEAQETLTRRQALLDVETAYASLVATRRTVQSFQEGVLPRTEALLHKVEQGYTLGASTILDLIDAQETYRTTRNDYTAAIGNHQQTAAQLERAVGQPLRSAVMK